MSDPQTVPVVIALVVLLVLLAIVVKRRKAQMPRPSLAHVEKSPEQIRADRLAREERERAVFVEEFAAARRTASGWFQVLGVLLIMVGGWLLLLNPGVADVVNLQKLYIGQTSALMGAVFLAAGVLLKFRPGSP